MHYVSQNDRVAWSAVVLVLFLSLPLVVHLIKRLLSLTHRSEPYYVVAARDYLRKQGVFFYPTPGPFRKRRYRPASLSLISSVTSHRQLSTFSARSSGT